MKFNTLENEQTIFEELRQWWSIFIHHQAFERRVESLTNQLLYTYWVSELENHMDKIMHPRYPQAHQEKNLTLLWQLTRHFLESSTQNYPHPVMMGINNEDEKSRALAAVISVHQAYISVFCENPDDSFLDNKKYREIFGRVFPISVGKALILPKP